MSKFKIGAKIKCVNVDSTIHMTRDKVYTVTKLKDAVHPYVLNDIGVEDWWHSVRFELVTEGYEYLTPEQVLQYFKEGRQSELEYIQPNGVTLNNMTEYTGLKYLFEGEWRVKSVPKTIDYYGTELPKPIDISKLDGSTVVYVPQLHRDSVISIRVEQARRIFYYGKALHFSTREDAKLVLDTLRKPFKQ